ncbi:hypothetical protein DFH28DRAFT_929537 [Melampsora americana]|nr:hypothetical protein DFH28DRAFT_929537 [Melampsora americana]
MPSMRSSDSNSGMSLTDSTTSSQRSNKPTLLRICSFGSRKFNHKAGHSISQINHTTLNESQGLIPSPISSQSIPSSFETLETESDSFKNPKSRSNFLPLPKLFIRKSISKKKKILQITEIETQENCERNTSSSLHQISNKPFSTIPELVKDSNSNQFINQFKMKEEENQMNEVQRLIKKKGLIEFDQNEFIKQRIESKEDLELEDEFRLFELSVNQISKRRRAKSEHKPLRRMNEEVQHQFNHLRLSYEVPLLNSNSNFEVKSFKSLQTDLQQPSQSLEEPSRDEIFQPLSSEISTENPQVFVSHYQNEETTDYNTHEDNKNDDDDGIEDNLSLYELTPEEYEVEDELILPQWPNHL